MIVVLGATGRVGRQVVEQLIGAGEKVRAVGRASSKLEELRALGADVVAGDAHDAQFLASALAGASAAFVMQPHDVRSVDYHAAQDVLGNAIAAGLREARVPYIVFLSSIGADVPEGNGVVGSLHRQEQRLRALPKANVLMLRAGAFYENFFEALPVIKEQGVIADAIAPETWVPMVATRDIARIAATALRSRDWQGVRVREITGPRDITHLAATRIIASAIGRPELQYVHVPYEAMIATFVHVGFTPSVAEAYVGLSRGINEQRVAPREPHSARHLGETSFESFAEEIAAAYRRMP